MFRYSIRRTPAYTAKCAIVNNAIINSAVHGKEALWQRNIVDEFAFIREQELITYQHALMHNHEWITHVPVHLRSLEANLVSKSLDQRDYLFWIHPNINPHPMHSYIYYKLILDSGSGKNADRMRQLLKCLRIRVAMRIEHYDALHHLINDLNE